MTTRPKAIQLAADPTEGAMLCYQNGVAAWVPAVLAVPGLSLFTEFDLMQGLVERAQIEPVLSNAAWTPLNLSVTGSGPWTLTRSGTGDSYLTATATGIQSYNHAKLEVVTAPGTESWILIGQAGGSSGRSWFNLTTGIVGTRSGACIASKMTSVGGGYWRCEALFDLQGSDYRINNVSADNVLTGVDLQTTLVSSIKLQQVRAPYVSNKAIEVLPLASLAATASPSYFRRGTWTDTTDVGVFDASEGICCMTVSTFETALANNDIGKTFDGVDTKWAFYFVIKRHTASGGTDHTICSIVGGATEYIKFGFTDTDFFAAHKPSSMTEDRVVTPMAAIGEWRLCAAYFDGVVITVAVAATSISGAVEPGMKVFNEFNLGGETSGTLTPSSAESNLMAAYAIVGEYSPAFGDTTDLVIRNYIKNRFSELSLVV